MSIVNWGTGYETLPWKQWCCNLCWKGRDCAQSFVLMFTLTFEYLNRNVSIGQLLQHISKSIVVFARSRPKMQQKHHITKNIVRLHNRHCLLLTMTWTIFAIYTQSSLVNLKVFHFILWFQLFTSAPSLTLAEW